MDNNQVEIVAAAAGMQWECPSNANWWPFENLDNAQTGLHDHLMYRKYGYGRGCAQLSVDIRNGDMDRAQALRWVQNNDGRFPWYYAGVSIHDVLAPLDLTMETLLPLLNRFTNWDLFRCPDDRADVPPILINDEADA